HQALPVSLLIDHKEGSMENETHAYSSIHSLAADLQQSLLAREGKLNVEVLEGADASVLVTLPEFGDLPVHLALSGEQLVIEVFLWPADQVKDRAGMNEQILRLQKLFPFTNMALEPLAQGGEGYVMFSALRTSSNCDDIVCGILTLSDSVIQATEALESYLSLAQA
ncbi:MAG TPA: YjfI family protein, partial [Comamonas sp.]